MMLIREFTYGVTPCLVQVTVAGGSLCNAELYVLEDKGRVLRRVGDRTGTPVEFPASCTEEALNCAATYLYKRFGPLTKDAKARGVERSVRPIIEPPLRDER